MKNGLTITNMFSGTNGSQLSHLPIKSIQELQFESYQVEGRKGVSIFTLYEDHTSTVDGPACAIVRYAPGAVTPRHLHPSWELILVLEGELIDDRGHHTAGVLQVYPPNSSHELSSENGCTFLVVWEKPVQPVASHERN
jgi:anti-sigma factor ChrR (cupin superfamily)